MQIVIHPSEQETISGETSNWIEPGLRARSIVINVTQISVNLFGNVAFKLQHSPDNIVWFDVPNLATGGLSATGAVIISLSENLPTLDNIRLVWTFNNSNSITFTGLVLGDK